MPRRTPRVLPSSPSRAARTRAATAAAVLGLALALGACGSDDEGSSADDDTSSSAAAPAPSDSPSVSAEFQECLAEQGVEVPTEAPEEGEMPSFSPEMQEAFEACADLAPAGAGGSGAPGVDQSALDAFASCMADNGVEVEASLEATTALDQSDPQVSAALETCSPLLQP